MLFSPHPTELPEARQVGGKGRSLLKLHQLGHRVPPPLCLGTEGYDRFVDHNRLREKINLLLHRKPLKDMRWEEIWDICLEIRYLFSHGAIPADLAASILDAVASVFGTKPLAIRSSAPEEDTLRGSFAGLHDSYIEVQGEDEVLQKIKLVWASLWSDRAVLYRQELGLDPAGSSMAVIIQEFLPGRVSGVGFSRDPLDGSRLTIEAVKGNNQQLVDGTTTPERWQLDRHSLRQQAHVVPDPADDGTGSDRARYRNPLLSPDQVREVASLCLQLEAVFGLPQDVEWTFTDAGLQVLQSRPITTAGETDQNDRRAWYLSLTRSYRNLVELRAAIEDQLLPRLAVDAERLAGVELAGLSDIELAAEIRNRASLNQTWTSIYWQSFIPFAHGVRLFGQIYNDLMTPDDPFEFIRLLTGQRLLSTARNRLLHRCAELIRTDEGIRRAVQRGTLAAIANEAFQTALSQLRNRFSMGSAAPAGDAQLAEILLQYAQLEPASGAPAAAPEEELEAAFLARGGQKLPMDPDDLLELARASYRIRDDDNIYVSRIGQELDRALTAAGKRLFDGGEEDGAGHSVEELTALLEGHPVILEPAAKPVETRPVAQRSGRLKARQLLGQPASRGLARGPARVVKDPDDLAHFRQGEILVIDSIDPTMTFFAPLAAAIVERRGGMLIHGAIIAREYGLPCITGVTGATELIYTGERLTVDGYLGIVTVHAEIEQEATTGAR